MPEITAFKDTDINDIEFFVCMRKPEVKAESVKSFCLASVPNLSLETLISPYMPQVRALSESLKTITEVHQDFQKSFNRLEAETKKQCDETISLRKQLNVLQMTLNRKSIKYTLKLVHIFYSVFSFLKGKSG